MYEYAHLKCLQKSRDNSFIGSSNSQLVRLVSESNFNITFRHAHTYIHAGDGYQRTHTAAPTIRKTSSARWKSTQVFFFYSSVIFSSSFPESSLVLLSVYTELELIVCTVKRRGRVSFSNPDLGTDECSPRKWFLFLKIRSIFSKRTRQMGSSRSMSRFQMSLDRPTR